MCSVESGVGESVWVINYANFLWAISFWDDLSIKLNVFVVSNPWGSWVLFSGIAEVT